MAVGSGHQSDMNIHKETAVAERLAVAAAHPPVDNVGVHKGHIDLANHHHVYM